MGTAGGHQMVWSLCKTACWSFRWFCPAFLQEERKYISTQNRAQRGLGGMAQCSDCRNEDPSSSLHRARLHASVIPASGVGRDRKIPRTRWPVSLREAVSIWFGERLFQEKKMPSPCSERHVCLVQGYTHLHTLVCAPLHTHTPTSSHASFHWKVCRSMTHIKNPDPWQTVHL